MSSSTTETFKPDTLPGYRPEDMQAASVAYDLGQVLFVEKPGVAVSEYSWCDNDSGAKFVLTRGTQDDGVTPCGFFGMSVEYVGMPPVGFSIAPRNCYAEGPNANLAIDLYGARFGAKLADGLAGEMRKHIDDLMSDASVDFERRKALGLWLIAYYGLNGPKK